MAINFANGNKTQKYKSNVVKVSHFSDATRSISVSNNNAATLITFNFSKEFSDTSILIFGFTPCAQQSSYHAGCFLSLKNASGTAHTAQIYEAANFMSPYDNNVDHPYGQISLHYMFENSANTVCQSTGTKTVGIGWHSRNNSSQQPSRYWNPENLSARIRARTTQLTVMELADEDPFIT